MRLAANSRRGAAKTEAIQEDLNPDVDRDMLARMRDPARERSMLRLDITEDELAEYLALAERFENFTHWISGRGS